MLDLCASPPCWTLAELDVIRARHCLPNPSLTFHASPYDPSSPVAIAGLAAGARDTEAPSPREEKKEGEEEKEVDAKQ